MFTAHLPITDQDASGTRDDPSRRPNKSHVAFIERSSIPPALANGMDRLRAPHDNLVIISKRLAPGKFRIVELSRLGEIGVTNIPIPSSASFNQQGIIVVNYRYFPDWQTKDYPSPILITYRLAPSAQPTYLSMVESNVDYPSSIRTLAIPGDKRRNRLSLRIHRMGDEERLLAVKDNQSGKTIGYIPADLSTKLLRWTDKDPHYSLHISTTWHIAFADAPQIQIIIYPYWKSAGRKAMIAPEAKLITDVIPDTEMAVIQSEVVPAKDDMDTQTADWIKRLNGDQDKDRGGRAAQRRYATRRALQQFIAISPADRATYDCLTKTDLETLKEVLDVSYPLVVDTLRIRYRQGQNPADLDKIGGEPRLSIVSDTSDVGSHKVPTVSTALDELWDLDHCAEYLRTSVAQIKKILKKHPEIVASTQEHTMADAGKLAMLCTGHSYDRRPMLTIQEVAEYVGVAPTTVHSWCIEHTLPHANISSLACGKEMLRNSRRVSVINLMSRLGVPENVELIRMKDAIQLCKDTGITHLSDARIETIITKHLESVLHTLSCEARLYVKDDVMYIIEMMGEMVD